MSEAILRPMEAARRCGISRSMLFALKAKGEFPTAVKLSSRTIGFRERDVDAWINARPTEDAAAAQPVGQNYEEV